MKTLLLLMLFALLPSGSSAMHPPAEEQLFIEVAATIEANNYSFADREDEWQLQIWPNPAQDILHIEINADSKQSASIEYQIFNAIGVVVQHDFVANGNQIDVSELSEGMYILKVNFEDNLQTRSFLKR